MCSSMGIKRETRKIKKSKDVKGQAKRQFWGYHLIINAGGCDAEAIRSKDTIAAFSKELVNRIDMVAHGKPLIVNFGEGNKKGYSLVQLIETSNITGHFVEETNDMYLDIFSCKSFDPALALDVLKEYFSPSRIHKTFLKRQAP